VEKDLKELDVNPVIVLDEGHGAVAVDALALRGK
jgi:succinyl-CoA synthetase beta subunit